MEAAPQIRACVERRLPEALLLGAAAHSIDEWAGNAPDRHPATGRTRRERVRLAINTGRAWSPGRTLRVHFLDGDPDVWARVEAFACQWMNHANIRFEFGIERDADIRVTFGGGGSWSLTGTEALSAPRRAATMSLGWLTRELPDRDYAQVVLHEFGHALGCIHEHQNPGVDIPWNREAVYAFYQRPPNGWSPEEVDRNVLEPSKRTQTQFSRFDPKSIMIYPIPKELLTCARFAVDWNSSLSATDKLFIRKRYPFPDRSLPELLSGGPAAEGAISAPGDEESYRFEVRTPSEFVVETAGITDVVMTLFGPNDEKRVVAHDEGGGLGGNARIAEPLIEGAYVVTVRHKRPTGTGSFALSLNQAG